MAIFVLVRAITYATIFMGLVLFLLPAWLLGGAGIERPASIGAIQVAGTAVALTGAVLALWCVLAFVVIGQGTPAPFDPPRLLVVRGPYAAVRNPMYIGAGLVLLGAALFFQSFALAGLLAAYWLPAHLFVVAYEEPALRRTFGADYEAYCRRVRRWWPHLGGP